MFPAQQGEANNAALQTLTVISVSRAVYSVESGAGDDDGLWWDRNGLVVECFRWGAVKELDLKEKVDSCLSPGWPEVTHGAVAVASATGRSNSYSAPHLEQ